jgi:hypothetical protein
MAWKKRSTSVEVEQDVSLDEFEDDQLLQALIDSGRISEAEAEAILNRSQRPVRVDPDDLETARTYAMRGLKEDACHFLERALGTEWIGTLT